MADVGDHYRQQDARRQAIDSAYAIAQHNYRVDLVSVLGAHLLSNFLARPPARRLPMRGDVVTWELEFPRSGSRPKFLMTSTGEIHNWHSVHDGIGENTRRVFTRVSTVEQITAQNVYDLRLICFAVYHTLLDNGISFDHTTWAPTHYPDGLIDKAGYRPPGRYGQPARKGFLATLFGL